MGGERRRKNRGGGGGTKKMGEGLFGWSIKCGDGRMESRMRRMRGGVGRMKK